MYLEILHLKFYCGYKRSKNIFEYTTVNIRRNIPFDYNYLKNLSLWLLLEGGFVVEEVDEKVFFLQGFFDFVEDIFALGFNCVEMIAGSCVR